MRKIILWTAPVIAIPLSIWFLLLGNSARQYYQGSNDDVSTTGEWVDGKHSSIHEQSFACPTTGELVGDVWQSGDTWEVSTNSDGHYNALKSVYKSESHAKHAAENFIREYKICEKRK